MEPPNTRPKERGSIGTGIALIVLGLLVLVPSGLCTGFLSFEALVEPDWSSALMPLAIGGPFVFGGGYLIWRGIKQFRNYLRTWDED